MTRIKGRSARVITLSMLLGLSLVGLSLLLARPPAVTATAVPVTNTDDSGMGSLRAAISSAMAGDMIVFNLPAGSTTITLTSDELLINKNLTISGPGANLLTVQRSTAGGTPKFRIFHIASGNFNVTISGLTIANGDPGGESAGGGILTQSTDTLNVTNCTISSNSITDFGSLSGIGGGISNFTSSGTLNVINSTISGNSAAGGGGIQNGRDRGGTLNVTNSTISGNSATEDGGGIANFTDSTANVTNSTISGNSTTGVSDGGGIKNGGALNVTNSTISSNSATNTGGGIANVATETVNVTNCTISGNSGGDFGTGGIENAGHTMNLKNTIIAKNTSTFGFPDVSLTFTSQGYNLIGNNSGATITPTTGDQIGTAGSPINPLLGSLQNNGGPTFTRALLSGSPAIDKGSAATGITTDQRGFTRPVDNPAIANATGGDGSDIGAFEGQVPTVWPGTSTPIPRGIGNFTSVGGPSLSGTVIAFFGAGSGAQQGIYRAEPVGPPITIADTNTAIPNGTGNFTDFAVNGVPPNPCISGSNVAFFGAGSGGQQGIYRALPGQPIKVADTNTAIPNGTGNFTDFTVNGVPSGPLISGANVAFLGNGSGGQQGIHVAVQSGPPEKVADTNTAIPGGTGNFVALPSGPLISGSNVAFLGSGSGSQQGVYLSIPTAGMYPPSPAVVADTNTSIPGGVGHFTGFLPPTPIAPAISGQNVAFFGMGSGGQQGIYVALPNGPIKVADTNTAIPGGIGNFMGFGPVSMSETDVTFLGTGSGGQTGLYDLTGGMLVKVVDMNTMIDGKRVTGLLFSNTGLSGDPVAFTATFSDGSQNIYVSDVAPTPAACTLTCPANITQSNDPNQCGAVVTYPAPTTTGTCGTVTCSPLSGSFFPKGTTTVTCSEPGGASCSFTVTVNDNEAPVLSGCNNVNANTASNACTAVVSYTQPTANDNCDEVRPVTCSPASGSTFNKGVTTITCTASDLNTPTANTGSCTFTVTVNDTQNPSVTCPNNITFTTPGNNDPCGVVTYTTPTGSDNCAVQSVVCNPPSGTCFTVGMTTVTCTATDTSNNTGQCTFKVTVQNPVQNACTINCPANQTASTGPGATQCGAVVNYPAPTTTGAGCGTVACSPASGSFFPVGMTTVTCTTTAGPSCTFKVTVSDDTPPVFSSGCPAAITLAAQASCPFATSTAVSFTAPAATDNCPGVTLSCNPPSGSMFPVGTITVTCTATDGSNNTAQCTFPVNVFSFCLQDDSSSRNVVFVNAITGDYLFCSSGVAIASGRGTLTVRACEFDIDSTKGNRKVHIHGDTAAANGNGAGTAVIQKTTGPMIIQITDKNMTNNTCSCSPSQPPGRPRGLDPLNRTDGN